MTECRRCKQLEKEVEMLIKYIHANSGQTRRLSEQLWAARWRIKELEEGSPKKKRARRPQLAEVTSNRK